MDPYFDNYKRQLNLLLDRNRTLKYKYAIFKAIKPDDLVIDFGCGTGILGFFALQAGARHVYAIESTSIINYAQKLAIKNGLEDRISFINKPGKEVTMEDISENVDIILSEPISNLLLEGDAWSNIQYLKQFLKPEGLIIPASGSLFIVPVNSSPKVYLDSNMLIGGANVYNIDFMELSHGVFYKSTLGKDSWLSTPQPLLEINLLGDKLSDTYHNSVKFTIDQPGQLLGLEFHFKVKIFENLTLSSRDQVDYHNWSPLFAPSSIHPLLSSGDQLRITIKNEKVTPTSWLWTTEYEHYSKLLPSTDVWWKGESAIPKIAPGVILSKTGLIRLKQDEYFQYDHDNDLEWDFIQLLTQSLNCKEISQIILQSHNYELKFEDILSSLVQLIHKLIRNSLIEIPVPKERFQVTRFQSTIHMP